MNPLDPQLARLDIIVGDGDDRPAPEPSEIEIRQIIDHINAREAQTETKETAR